MSSPVRAGSLSRQSTIVEGGGVRERMRRLLRQRPITSTSLSDIRTTSNLGASIIKSAEMVQIARDYFSMSPVSRNFMSDQLNMREREIIFRAAKDLPLRELNITPEEVEEWWNYNYSIIHGPLRPYLTAEPTLLPARTVLDNNLLYRDRIQNFAIQREEVLQITNLTDYLWRKVSVPYNDGEAIIWERELRDQLTPDYEPIASSYEPTIIRAFRFDRHSSTTNYVAYFLPATTSTINNRSGNSRSISQPRLEEIGLFENDNIAAIFVESNDLSLLEGGIFLLPLLANGNNTLNANSALSGNSILSGNIVYATGINNVTDRSAVVRVNNQLVIDEDKVDYLLVPVL